MNSILRASWIKHKITGGARERERDRDTERDRERETETE